MVLARQWGVAQRSAGRCGENGAGSSLNISQRQVPRIRHTASSGNDARHSRALAGVHDLTEPVRSGQKSRHLFVERVDDRPGDDHGRPAVVIRFRDGAGSGYGCSGCAAREPGGFRLLYRAVQPGLLRYLRVLVGAEAEDVAAEAWLQIARDLAAFRGDADGFRGRATTIARPRAMDPLRQRRRRPVAVDAEVEHLAELPGTADAARFGGRGDVDRRGAGADRAPAAGSGRGRAAVGGRGLGCGHRRSGAG
ncbi:sigma factor [Actinophytocola sp.]|uniref:sigma factor n=1 Tax=Actinophytocola sp. TaxID=1872138 RepID=UPI0039C89BA0